MKMKSKLYAALIAGAVSVSSGQALASPISVFDGMSAVTVSTIATTNPPVNFDPAYFELNVADSNGAQTYFTLIDTDPEVYNVSYELFADADTNLGTFTTGASLLTWSFTDILGSATQTYTSLLAAGQYVLKIATDGAYSSSTRISAVPLPGAALLFGSALLGMGALRRKQKAEMAAA